MSTFRNITRAEITFLTDTNGTRRVNGEETFEANNFFKIYCTSDNPYGRILLELIHDDGVQYPPNKTNIKTINVTEPCVIPISGKYAIPVNNISVMPIFKKPPYHFQISNFGSSYVVVKINKDDTGFKLYGSMVQVFEAGDVDIEKVTIESENETIEIEIIITGGEFN
jgi:hypothetical protein